MTALWTPWMVFFPAAPVKKMLVIMKDSCVGSNAVVAFAAYLILAYALLAAF